MESALLNATSCSKCKRKLALSGPKAKVGFRCFHCMKLVCHRCAKKHFGDLDAFSYARRDARLLLRSVRSWLGKTKVHS